MAAADTPHDAFEEHGGGPHGHGHPEHRRASVEPTNVLAPRTWRSGTESGVKAAAPPTDSVKKSYKEKLTDILFETNENKGFDENEHVESIFEAIDGPYLRPITLREYEDELDGREYKSSWDELFFDLALVAAFGSLATTLSLQAPLEHHGDHAVHHYDDHGDDHGDDHAAHSDHRRRLSSGGLALAHLSFSQSVFLYCLETATVISVRRFTDGHRAQWRRNDLFGSVLLLARAICCLGMGACAHLGNEGVWKFHAWNVVANGVGLWSVIDSFLSRPRHFRTLSTEAINLLANAAFSLVFALLYAPKIGDYTVGWGAYAIWVVYTPFMFCGSWMLPHSGVGPNSTSRLPINVEYISERFGLLVIITCGESLFAAIAILQQGESVEKLCVAGLSVYYALLIKLLYFELQSHVSKHAMFVNRLRGILWTMAHLPVFVCAAGSGAVLHWAATGVKWTPRERNLFLAFTVVLLLSLSLVALFHGKLHNDHNAWWTKKKARISIRLVMCAFLVVGSVIDDKDNVYTILYACGLITLDFSYEFMAKRQIAIEHEEEVEEHVHERELVRAATQAVVAAEDVTTETEQKG